MKCENCGHENFEKAKFCTKCGKSLATKKTDSPTSQNSNMSKYIIIGLITVIIILGVGIGYYALNMNSHSPETNAEDSAASQQVSSSENGNTSTKEIESKSWESIGSYSGSGTGSKTIEVPEGKIMVKLSAYPIKNYATNHLYVTGSNGKSGGVDWGSHSDVETRSDSFEYSSSSNETFTIDYYETVNWEVEFYRYQ